MHGHCTMAMHNRHLLHVIVHSPCGVRESGVLTIYFPPMEGEGVGAITAHLPPPPRKEGNIISPAGAYSPAVGKRE